LRFYVGTFSNDGQYFKGKVYFHLDTLSYKLNKKEEYERDQDLELNKYLQLASIQKGLPHFEGAYQIESLTGNFPYFSPDGSCMIRFVKESTSDEPYTQIEGEFSNGYPSYITVTKYKNSKVPDYVFFMDVQ
jgi:hypothetical protein